MIRAKYKFSLIRICFCALLLGPLSAAQAADVAYFTILKTQFLVQTNNAAPTPASTNAYAFTAAVAPASNGLVTAATVTPAGKPTRTLASDPSGVILGFNFGPDNPLLTYVYATNSQAGIDALFPTGVYFNIVNYAMAMQTLNEGTKSASLGWGAYGIPINFPSTPQVTNLTDCQVIDSTMDFTLRWTIASGSTLQILQFTVSDAASNMVFTSPAPLTPGALNGVSNRIVIPAHTLGAGGIFQAHLAVAQPGLPNTNEYLGAIGIPALVKDVAFSLQTRPAPPSPQLTQLPSPAGQFRLKLQGETNRTYQILAAEDLNAWTPVLITNCPSGLFEFTEMPAPPPPRRFYRAKVGL